MRNISVVIEFIDNLILITEDIRKNLLAKNEEKAMNDFYFIEKELEKLKDVYKNFDFNKDDSIILKEKLIKLKENLNYNQIIINENLSFVSNVINKVYLENKKFTPTKEKGKLFNMRV